jgi:Na+-translocating ferredoxin:NAD+ oxidoreductase RNF subunit RnfB
MVGVLILAIIGLIAGFFLAFAAKKFFVAKDPKELALLEALPGTNCGACGYPGCTAMSKAMAAGGIMPSACTVANEAAVAKLAEILGVSAVTMARKVARLTCGGDKEKCPSVADYSGPADCGVMAATSGAGKACTYGCMGGGSCVRVCMFDAMKMGENGLPIIDESKCTACGLCVKACPRKLLRLIRQDRPVYVACLSGDKGPVVRKICTVGCIACKICEKSCPDGAITVENFIATVDPEKCTSCNICVEKCPTKCILNVSEHF